LKNVQKRIKCIHSSQVDDFTAVSKNIIEAREVLIRATISKQEDADKVVDSLLALEKLMREKNRLYNFETGSETLAQLHGCWRLVFTTGTVDTQKKYGRRVNYFPVKAVQSFDTNFFKITNGIYLGNFEILKFFGQFEFNVKSRKLVFDFDEIAVAGFKFPLPKGGAAKIGQKTGLGSEGNVMLAEKNKKPFFNWISADTEIATARGGGGGLALWRRDLEMERLRTAGFLEKKFFCCCC